MISSEAPQSGLANLMAMKGRYGDTELVHMSRPEVQGLASLGKITINPDTGLPEAFKLGGIFKTLIPMAATAVGGFFGGPMGAAAGNALGQFAMGERDIGKIALQSMLTYGMGAMSASSGTAAAGATGSSTATTAGNATRAGMVGDGLNAGYNASQASLGSVSQVAPYVSPSSFGDGAIYSQSAGSPSGFNAYLSSDAIPYNPPSAVASALQAPTPQANLYNFEGSPGFAGTPFGKIEGGTNLTAAQTAKQGVTTIKTPDGNYISASDMKMDPTDYAKAHFSRPSTLIGGGLSAISNGVFEEEQPEYKENERIPYKPKNLKLISDPNTGKHRYIEITDEEAQQSRFAAEGGLIGLDNGGYVSRVNTFLNPERVQNTDPLGESLDGLQSLSSDMNIGSTSLLEPTAPMQPRTLDINTDKTAVNNGGLTLEEFGNGQHRYIRNDPLVETIIEANDPSSVQGVPDDISDNAEDNGSNEGMGSGSSASGSNDGSGSASNSDGPNDGNDIATGGLVGLTNSGRQHLLRRAEGGTMQYPRTSRDASYKDSKNKNSFNLKDFNSIVELGVGYPELERMLNGETAASKSIAKRITATNPSSGAAGIFQFTPKAAKELGTSTAKIKKMTVKEQSDLYAKYLKRWKYKPGISLGMMQAAPSLINKPDDFVVYKKGSEAYEQNPGWVGGDGEITAGSIKRYYNKDNDVEQIKEEEEESGILDRISKLIKFSEGGTLEQYYQGQVIGKGDGMSDEILFDVEGRNPDMALLSRDEYVIPADVVSMIGNGSSNAGAEELDGFLKNVRQQSFGTRKQQREMTNPQKGLSALV